MGQKRPSKLCTSFIETVFYFLPHLLCSTQLHNSLQEEAGIGEISAMLKSMGRLTTHVLDAAHGCPGSDIRIELYRVEGERLELVTTRQTNNDGRCDSPLLEGDDYRSGVYQLQFSAGDYYRARGVTLPEPAFLDVVVLRFGISAEQDHYHVPLLISPYSYSTYRGS